MKDPILALFTARLVESRLGMPYRVHRSRKEKSYEDGFMLGPESRKVLKVYLLPTLDAFRTGVFFCKYC
jgi:hypothetical protein